MIYDALKFAHIIGASVLLGTGAGIAFFMLQAHRSKDAALVAGVARMVVTADFLFTATAVVLQPITGVLLAMRAGFPFTQGWILLSIVLFVVTGAFWLPVVWMQIRMQRLASEAAALGAALPDKYYRLFHLWFACGIPAFAAVLGIFWLMISKTTF